MARWLLIIIVVASVAWGGWWVVGSTATERGAVAAIDAARAEGWDIAYDDLSVSGFPNRFDVTVTAPQVTAPDGAYGWTAPFFQVFALSYRPNHVIAIAPETMTLDTPAGPVDIGADDLRASVVVAPAAEPTLRRATVVATALDLTGAFGAATLARGQLATREASGPMRHDVALTLADLRLPDGVLAAFDPGRVLPPAIEVFDLDADVTLDRALAMGTEPRLETIRLRRANLRWGDVALTLSGDVAIGSDGVPTGALTLRADGWETLLRLAAQSGLISPGSVPLISAGLSDMAQDGRIEIELDLRDGQVVFGALPLAPLPRLPVPQSP